VTLLSQWLSTPSLPWSALAEAACLAVETVAAELAPDALPVDDQTVAELTALAPSAAVQTVAELSVSALAVAALAAPNTWNPTAAQLAVVLLPAPAVRPAG